MRYNYDDVAEFVGWGSLLRVKALTRVVTRDG